MQMHPWKKNLRLALACASIWVSSVTLMSCGGGDLISVIPGVGSGGTGSVAGTITGLGSVIVDGVRYDDSAAVLERQADLLQSQTLSLSDLQVGQYVYLNLDAAGTPVRFRLESQLVGTVGSTTPGLGQLTVWGQTVGVNTDPSLGPVTLFSGYAGLADVRATDLVQVYGALQADPTDTTRERVRATRIERLVDASSLPARVTGTLRSDGTRLLLAGLPLNQATISNLSASQSLQAGMAVTVVLPWPSKPDLMPAQWDASSIRLLGQANAGAGTLRLSGIAQFGQDGMANVQGVQVDLSAQSLAAVRARVTTGTYVTLSGRLNPNTGQLMADTLELTPAGGRPMDLRGSVTSWVDQSSFMVRGTRINANTAQWVGGAANQVANGRYVEVSGSLTGNVLHADRVMLQAGLPDKAVLDVTGQVQLVDLPQRLTQVLTQDGQILTVNFAATDNLPAMGDTVRVAGFWKDGALQARELSSPLPTDPALTPLEGIVDFVGNGEFGMNGLAIFFDPAMFASLRISQGERIEILVKRVADRYTLVKIDSKPPRH